MRYSTSYSQSRVGSWLAAALFALSVGCRGTTSVTIRELERAPSNHTGRLVTVRGCYHNGVESTLLQPCSDPKPDEVVWVLSRHQLEDTAKAVPGYAVGALRPEHPSPREIRLAEQLSQLPNGAFAEVVMRGEFRASSRAEFGRSPGYRYEFVVHRVLSVSTR